MSVKGSIVVDEVILPIVDIRLVSGEVQFVASTYGPLPAVDTRYCTIHDPDGRVVVRAHLDVSGLRWSRVRDHCSVTVVLPLYFISHEAWQSGRMPQPYGGAW